MALLDLSNARRKTNGLRCLWTEVTRAEELTKEVINWSLSYQTKVRGDSPSL